MASSFVTALFFLYSSLIFILAAEKETLSSLLEILFLNPKDVYLFPADKDYPTAPSQRWYFNNPVWPNVLKQWDFVENAMEELMANKVILLHTSVLVIASMT